jgi:hypothetical protein
MATIRLRVIGWASILIAVCLITIITDRAFGFYKNGFNAAAPLVRTRYLSLREWQPTRVWNGPPWDMEGRDGLLKKDYLLRADENGFIIPSQIHSLPDWTVVFLGGSTNFSDELVQR